MKKLMVLLLAVSMIGASLMMTSCGKKNKDTSALVGEGGEVQEQQADEKSEDKEKDKKSEDKKEEAKKSEDKKDSKKEDKKEDKKADTKSETKENTSTNSNTSEEAEEVKVTPSFMYFVSKKDADHEKTMEIVEELKKKYKGKVNFDITDIDENPEAKENFPVEGQTPMLIMLDTSNNISMMPQKITDKAKLEDAIENALGE